MKNKEKEKNKSAYGDQLEPDRLYDCKRFPLYFISLTSLTKPNSIINTSVMSMIRYLNPAGHKDT